MGTSISYLNERWILGKLAVPIVHEFDERVIYCLHNNIPMNVIAFYYDRRLETNVCVHNERIISTIYQYINNEIMYSGTYFKNLSAIVRKKVGRYCINAIDVIDPSTELLGLNI